MKKTKQMTKLILEILELQSIANMDLEMPLMEEVLLDDEDNEIGVKIDEYNFLNFLSLKYEECDPWHIESTEIVLQFKTCGDGTLVCCDTCKLLKMEKSKYLELLLDMQREQIKRIKEYKKNDMGKYKDVEKTIRGYKL